MDHAADDSVCEEDNKDASRLPTDETNHQRRPAIQMNHSHTKQWEIQTQQECQWRHCDRMVWLVAKALVAVQLCDIVAIVYVIVES